MTYLGEALRFDAPRPALKPVPFEDAIAAAERRKVVLPDVYYGRLQGYARAKAFSVAGLTSADQIEQVLGSLVKAMREGDHFSDWQKKVRDGDVPLTFPRHRLENIFRTNLQAAYGRGRVEQQERTKDRYPFLMYDAVNDSRTRPNHKALDGYIAPYNDPFWKTHTPPLGYQCRCTLVSLTKAQAQARGYGKQPEPDAQADEGWDYDKREEIEQGTRNAVKRRFAKAPKPVADALENIDKKGQSLDPATWRRIDGTQKGSNEGGLYEAPDGTRYYVKFYGDANQARTEVASARLYELAGVETVRPQIVHVGGRQAVASKFRDDLADLDRSKITPAQREDLARVYQASVLTKNWDMVGLSFDNLKVTPAGRVVIVDTGASFKFRAQGAAKPFGNDIAEVDTFLDPVRNQQAASLYKPLFDADVWLEQRGAAPLAAITREQIDAALAVGFDQAERKALSDALWARREALVDRYDLDGRHLPERFRPMVEKLKAWGAERIGDDAVRANVPAHEQFVREEVAKLMKKFSAHLDKTVYKGAGESARKLFLGWSGSSTSRPGGVMKLWAAERFAGVEVRMHRGGGAAGVQAAEEDVRIVSKAAGRSKDELFAVLDAEYAFHVYYLRRIHGWGRFNIDRGMSGGELASNYADGTFRGNGVSSATIKLGVWSAARRVRVQARPEYVLKTYFQGRSYMSFGEREAEYVLIGRALPATVVK